MSRLWKTCTMFKVKHTVIYRIIKFRTFEHILKFLPDAKFNPKYRTCPEFSGRYGNPSSNRPIISKKRALLLVHINIKSLQNQTISNHSKNFFKILTVCLVFCVSQKVDSNGIRLLQTFYYRVMILFTKIHQPTREVWLCTLIII